MSAPIDDLLYGGDDSGDEDDMNVAAVSMPAFGATPLLPAGAVPLTAPGASIAPGGAKPLSGAPVSAPASIVSSMPLSSVGLGVKSAVTPSLATAPAANATAPHIAAGSQPSTTATATSVTTTTPATAATGIAPKQAPGSGQQMFQQMFALLKQMLSPEQYATFYTEMRNGNGNDIKSIVDIIKRIAGDAMFSTLIQKLDLTRTFPTTATPAPTTVTATPATATVKSEPAAAAANARTSVPQRTASPIATTAPVTAASAPAAPQVPRAGSPAKTPPPPATAAPATLAQRPNLVPMTKSPSAVPAASSSSAAAAAALPAATVKPEPKPPAVTTALSTATASPAPTTATSPAAVSKNEQQLEKIEFAKKLLSHAATCLLTPGMCQVTKCDDVRRVFKHSVSCGGARSCSHCEQLKGLVKYHARECATAASDHCTIPFCDGLRRAYLASAATLASKAKASTSATAGSGANSSSGGTTAPRLGVTSDDDDDNTPLSSAVSKAKKQHAAKAKSPKASPTVRATAATPVPTTAAAKKKAAAAAAAASTPSTAASRPTTPATSSTSSTAGTTTAGGAGKGVPPKAAVTANMTVEYGRLLQLILHVQNCTATTCPVGDECAEAKSLLREINSPNAPPRAKTYKQVYSHYKVCVAKNNTGTCPMCKIGLQPILPADDDAGLSAATSPASQATATTATSASTSTSIATSPTASSTNASATTSSTTNKRSNSTVTPSPRSPSKKQRTSGGGNHSRVKAAPTLPDPAQTSAAELSGHDLTQASVADIRKEADVLTHTSIDLSAERRTMMDGAGRRRAASAVAGTKSSSTTERLACTKEQWLENDLFNSTTLQREMTMLARRNGVTLGAHTPDVMASALHEYLTQVVEEMVAVAKQRGDANAQAFELYQKSENADDGGSGTNKVVEVTSTDILRVSCEDAFARTRALDLALRAQVLDDAKREEAAEKERAKKRKKVDRSKLQQEERDEAEMDMDELAVKDLKDRLLQEDKDGVVRVDGRVNESIATKVARREDHQVAMEDADYWLESQKPYIRSKLFVRAEAARIVTKSLL